eukprot:PhM_4_TR13300/c0_g1_i1/m.77597
MGATIFAFFFTSVKIKSSGLFFLLFLFALLGEVPLARAAMKLLRRRDPRRVLRPVHALGRRRGLAHPVARTTASFRRRIPRRQLHASGGAHRLRQWTSVQLLVAADERDGASAVLRRHPRDAPVGVAHPRDDGVLLLRFVASRVGVVQRTAQLLPLSQQRGMKRRQLRLVLHDRTQLVCKGKRIEGEMGDRGHRGVDGSHGGGVLRRCVRGLRLHGRGDNVCGGTGAAPHGTHSLVARSPRQGRTIAGPVVVHLGGRVDLLRRPLDDKVAENAVARTSEHAEHLREGVGLVVVLRLTCVRLDDLHVAAVLPVHSLHLFLHAGFCLPRLGAVERGPVARLQTVVCLVELMLQLLSVAVLGVDDKSTGTAVLFSNELNAVAAERSPRDTAQRDGLDNDHHVQMLSSVDSGHVDGSAGHSLDERNAAVPQLPVLRTLSVLHCPCVVLVYFLDLACRFLCLYKLLPHTVTLSVRRKYFRHETYLLTPYLSLTSGDVTALKGLDLRRRFGAAALPFPLRSRGLKQRGKEVTITEPVRHCVEQLLGPSNFFFVSFHSLVLRQPCVVDHACPQHRLFAPHRKADENTSQQVSRGAVLLAGDFFKFETFEVAAAVALYHAGVVHMHLTDSVPLDSGDDVAAVTVATHRTQYQPFRGIDLLQLRHDATGAVRT